MYDVIIAGGGTAGCACAYTAAKLGLKVLLIEKNIHLGGSITSGFVMPVMKTASNEVNCTFYNDFINEMKKYNAQITYSDNNPGWFNPEIAKIVLDKMLFGAGCNILFDSEISNVSKSNISIKNIYINHKSLSLCFKSKYYVDATGDGNFSKKINHKFLEKENISQALTLRFLISGIDLEKFKDWVISIDEDRNVTNYAYVDGQLHLTTAYTWDNKKWGLKPIFEEALRNNDLQPADTAYFQLFTVASMSGTITLNCPRIQSDKDLDPLDPFDTTKALKTGREQIWRIYNFCKKYFKGFENSYISNIADKLGIRESRRVLGKYILSEEDIISGKKFENIACMSDYPIDIHGTKKNKSTLQHIKRSYSLPLESLKSAEFENLYIIGRCFSGTFKAVAALRTQANCFSMGEAAARDIYSQLN